MSLIENGVNLLHSNNNADTYVDGSRANYNRTDSWESESESRRKQSPDSYESTISKPDTNSTTNKQYVSNSSYQKNTVIFRFKFTENFMEELFEFSKIHQYDDRNDFKEAWKLWSEENDEIIIEETERLSRLGFIGDVNDKMFKSARYYFRKKSTETKQPVQRRKYITVNKELLDAMDLHIESNFTNEGYQPKNGFSDFCEEYSDLIKEVTNKIVEKGEGEPNMQLINDKIKKTYKNRYFIATNKY